MQKMKKCFPNEVQKTWTFYFLRLQGLLISASRHRIGPRQLQLLIQHGFWSLLNGFLVASSPYNDVPAQFLYYFSSSKASCKAHLGTRSNPNISSVLFSMFFEASTDNCRFCPQRCRTSQDFQLGATRNLSCPSMAAQQPPSK